MCAFIVIAAAGNAPPPELPLTIDGLQGWISTTKGQFRFGDGTAIPGNGKTVEEARHVGNGAVLFSQATATARPTWDANTFDVPCMRSNGTQYLTRSTSLTAPGLIVLTGSLDAPATDFEKLTGSRSTQTPGGDPSEDAWVLQRSNFGTMRGVIGTSDAVQFADVPELLGEKLIIMLEIVGSALQVWQVGTTGEVSITGTQIAAGAEQALMAGYYNDAIAGVLNGAVFEFLQYAPAPTRTERRDLVEYVQALLWPAVSPPTAAIIDAGQIEQGQSKLVDVVTPSSGASLMLTSIDEPPTVGGFSVSGNSLQISVPSGAPLGSYSGWYCLRSDVAGARLVDFGRVDFEVIEGTAPQWTPPTFADGWEPATNGSNMTWANGSNAVWRSGDNAVTGR
jgi:hypothetical protein